MASRPLEALLTVARNGRLWLATVPASAYATAQVASASTMGAQYRHHLDYLEALLTGMESGKVDYDGRARDLLCEQDLDVALQRAERLELWLERLIADPTPQPSSPLLVRESWDADQPPAWLPSTADREAVVVLAHAVHHYAILAVIAHACGLPVDREFSLAPATRRYRAGLARPSAATN